MAVAKSGGFSIAGGGETVTAIDHFSVRDKISYISTGGGAFLEYVQGIKLPAVQILEEKLLVCEVTQKSVGNNSLLSD